MRPHIKPLWKLGRPLLWECRARRFDALGWSYGKERGEGYTPKQAFDNWRRRVKPCGRFG